MVNCIKLLCLFLILFPLSQTQFYSSVAVMEILLGTQHKLISHIQNYLRYITDGKKARIVEKFLSRCIKEDQLARWNGEQYLGNPINAYTLILRLTRDITFIEKILNETTAGMKYQVDNTLAYPREEDVVGVVEGLTRLQLLYDLDVARMANGTLATPFATKSPVYTEKVTPMTMCDCFELGLVEYEHNNRSRNILWIKEALRRFEHDSECPIRKVDLYDRLIGDYFHIGDYNKTVYWMERRVDASPDHPRIAEYIQTIEALRRNATNMDKTSPYRNKQNSRDWDSFPAMCLKRYYSRNASLTCYYAHGPHRFLYLAPMKTELLHSSPLILLFHDVITDDEILAVKKLATPRFEQGKAVTEKGPSVVDYCIHQVAWLHDEWLQATVRVRTRISQLSGLQLNSGDDLQVANYGTGGYYGAHYDFIQPNLSTSDSKRLATALIHLEEVEEGGATVFTKLGLTVFPVKRAALFWWNLDRTGYGDFATQHAVCPMLRGSRWVLTRWISSSGQELVKPCPAPSEDGIYTTSSL